MSGSGYSFLMDNAMRRANARLGHQQCIARDLLLIELACAVQQMAEPAGQKGISGALQQFIEALAVPVPVLDKETP